MPAGQPALATWPPTITTLPSASSVCPAQKRLSGVSRCVLYEVVSARGKDRDTLNLNACVIRGPSGGSKKRARRSNT